MGKMMVSNFPIYTVYMDGGKDIACIVIGTIEQAKEKERSLNNDRRYDDKKRIRYQLSAFSVSVIDMTI